MDTTPYTLAHLSPLILEITKLSWDNLVETHSRWSEEVSSLCALAGNGVFASLQIPQTHQKASSGHNHNHNNNNGKKKKRKENRHKRMTTSFTEYDDHIAKSIIILCMTRDIRDRFKKFMKVATTSKKLFNGIAILRAAVSQLTILSECLSEKEPRG